MVCFETYIVSSVNRNREDRSSSSSSSFFEFALEREEKEGDYSTGTNGGWIKCAITHRKKEDGENKIGILGLYTRNRPVLVPLLRKLTLLETLNSIVSSSSFNILVPFFFFFSPSFQISFSFIGAIRRRLTIVHRANRWGE